MANGTIRGELANGVVEIDDAIDFITVDKDDDLFIVEIYTEEGSIVLELSEECATHLASSLVKKLKSREE